MGGWQFVGNLSKKVSEIYPTEQAEGQVQWFMLVIPVTWEAEIKRITIQKGRLDKKLARPCLNK
jgi:hypothetical protein